MSGYGKYWEARANRRISDRHKYLDASIQQIRNAYGEAMKELNGEIGRLFNMLVRETGLSRAELEKLLREEIPSGELEEIRKKIDLVTDETYRKQLLQKLDVSYYKNRISRREALRETISIQMSAIADEELKITTRAYTEAIREEYYRNIFDSQQLLGAAFRFDELPERVIEQILQDDWSGKHYSKRIWGNSEVMGRRIEEILLKGAMLGTNSRKMAKELDAVAETGMYACERLIRTETTYFTAMADLEAAKARGTEKVKFVATLDVRTSPQCRKADGRIIPVAAAKPGVNIPPLHPFCRSVIIDVIEGLVHKVRKARDPVTGKNYTVPADMTYAQWKKMPLAEKKMDIGQVKGITLQKPVGNTKLTTEQVGAIKNTISEVGEEYDLKLDYLEIGEYTDEEHIGAPMFYHPMLDEGEFKGKLVINNGCPFWTDKKSQDKVFESDYHQVRSLEDVVTHELAHVLTFQGCRTPEDYNRLDQELRAHASTGISKYATDQADCAEDIAEAFVKKRQGYSVNMRAEYLLQKYLEIWRK